MKDNIEQQLKNIESRLNVLEMDHGIRLTMLEYDASFADIAAEIAAEDAVDTIRDIFYDTISNTMREALDSYLLHRFGDAAHTKKRLKGHKLIITFK